MEKIFDIIPNKIITGERIVLSKPEVTFKFAIERFAIIEKNREHLLPWLDWAMPEFTKTAEDSFIFAYDADKDWEKHERFEYTIYDKITKEDYGSIGVMKRGSSYNKTFEFGFWLKQESCGKGFMLEAVKLLEDEFFNLGAERLIIRNDVTNTKSRKVAIKAGFNFEGCQRHGKWSEYMKNFVDINVFSKIKNNEDNIT